MSMIRLTDNKLFQKLKVSRLQLSYDIDQSKL